MECRPIPFLPYYNLLTLYKNSLYSLTGKRIEAVFI